MEPSDTLIIRGQQDFELYHQLNPTEIKIDNDKFINSLKNIKNLFTNLKQRAYYFPHRL